jgi:hypothetical protein
MHQPVTTNETQFRSDRTLLSIAACARRRVLGARFGHSRSFALPRVQGAADSSLRVSTKASMVAPSALIAREPTLVAISATLGRYNEDVCWIWHALWLGFRHSQVAARPQSGAQRAGSIVLLVFNSSNDDLT